jgi:hypothetical protein
MPAIAKYLAAIALFSGAVQAAGPDPTELVRRSVEVVRDAGAKARQYAYREYKVDRDLDGKGKETGKRTETWDVIGLEGSTYRKLVMRNDQPLPPKEQKREDDRMQKEAELRKRETPDERRRRLFSFSYTLSFPYMKIADLYDFRYLGEETLAGHPTQIIEGTPKSDYRPRTDDEKESLNYKVKLWLVEGDYHYARMELEVVGDHSRMQKGSLLDIDAAPQDDGVWLPTTQTFRFTARFLKTIDRRGEQTITFSDYRKFQVDSRIVN